MPCCCVRGMSSVCTNVILSLSRKKYNYVLCDSKSGSRLIKFLMNIIYIYSYKIIIIKIHFVINLMIFIRYYKYLYFLIGNRSKLIDTILELRSDGARAYSSSSHVGVYLALAVGTNSDQDPDGPTCRVHLPRRAPSYRRSSSSVTATTSPWNGTVGKTVKVTCKLF